MLNYNRYLQNKNNRLIINTQGIIKRIKKMRSKYPQQKLQKNKFTHLHTEYLDKDLKKSKITSNNQTKKIVFTSENKQLFITDGQGINEKKYKNQIQSIKDINKKPHQRSNTESYKYLRNQANLHNENDEFSFHKNLLDDSEVKNTKMLHKNDNKNRLKTESSKKLKRSDSSKFNSFKNLSKNSKPSKAKNQIKPNINNPENVTNYLKKNMNDQLTMLKSKFKKNDKKTEKNECDFKNMTISNLSHILHRNQKFSQWQQTNTLKSQLTQRKKQIEEIILSELQTQLDFLSVYVDKLTLEKQIVKNKYQTKSNFSTGQQSFGTNYNINKKIFNQCSEISIKIGQKIKKLLELSNGTNKQKTKSIFKSKKIQESIDFGCEEQKQAPNTFRQHLHRQCRNQKQISRKKIFLLSKYHEISTKMIFFQKNNELKEINYCDQKDKLMQFKYQQKFLGHFKQLSEKNNKYQQIINNLIKQGINVESYIKKIQIL